MIIKNGTVLRDDFKFYKTSIHINGDTLSESADGEVIDATDCYVLPGLIDSHVHGGGGALADERVKPESLGIVSRFLASKGVTTFAPTTHTLSVKDTVAAINMIGRQASTVDGAKVGGIHLEGPFISHEYKGALLEKNIKLPDTEIFDTFRNTPGGELIKLITVAPELPEAEKLIRHIVSCGVKVSMGHSNATYDEAEKSADWGVTQATHTYNAMRGLNHREPAILGVAMNDDRIKCELICDFIHVSPAACKILFKLKTAMRMNMISDSDWPAGLPDGDYIDGGRVMHMRDGKLLLDDGTIAASTKWMLFGVQNFVRQNIMPFEDAVRIASINPAKTLGIDDITGSIKPGKKADIIILNKDLELLRTIVNGKTVYKV